MELLIVPATIYFQVTSDKTCRSHGVTGSSLRASSPIWASKASLATTRERGAARLVSLAQIGELARRLNWLLHCQSLVQILSSKSKEICTVKPHANLIIIMSGKFKPAALCPRTSFFLFCLLPK